MGALILPYFISLTHSSLWDSTEAFYAETPREMIERGSFIVPYFNYEPRLNKPPLSYWLVIPFYRVLGVSSISERLVNALGACLLILLTFAFGCLIFSRQVALLGAALVATTPRLVLIAQKSIIDTYFTLFVTAALFLFWRLTTVEKSRRLAALFYLVLGLGVLTKGPLALVLVGAIIGIFFLVTRRWTLLPRLHVTLGILILTGMVLPWFVAIYFNFGWEPIATFVFRENLGRLTSSIDWSSRGPLYYLIVLAVDFFPWSLFLIPVGVMSFRKARQNETRHEAVRFLIIWMGFMLIFFSLASNKHEYYLLPFYPAAAVLIARFFVHLMDETTRAAEKRSALVITWILGLFFATVGIMLVLVVRDVLHGSTLSYAMLLLTAGGLWILFQARRQTLRTVPGSLVGLMLASILLYQVVYLPSIERYRPTRDLCQVIKQEARPSDLVGTYNFAAPSMTFYLQRRMFELFDPDAVASLLRSDHRIFCLMTARDFHRLKPLLPAHVTVLERRPSFRFRPTLLWNQPAEHQMTQLLLISNRGSASSSPGDT